MLSLLCSCEISHAHEELPSRATWRHVTCLMHMKTCRAEPPGVHWPLPGSYRHHREPHPAGKKGTTLHRWQKDSAAGYNLERAAPEPKRMRSWGARAIPPEFNYSGITALSIESREKLSKFRPENVSQASRIAGVTPADLSILMVHLERYKNNS